MLNDAMDLLNLAAVPGYVSFCKIEASKLVRKNLMFHYLKRKIKEIQ